MAMPDIVFRLRIFRNKNEKKRSENALYALLYALCSINLGYLKQYPNTVKLYKAGVRYQAEPEGQEEWKDIPTIVLDGHGDCEDLACWRVAELMAEGVKARPFIRWRGVPGFSMYHILVRHPNGRIEDPSIRLGM